MLADPEFSGWRGPAMAGGWKLEIFLSSEMLSSCLLFLSRKKVKACPARGLMIKINANLLVSSQFASARRLVFLTKLYTYKTTMQKCFTNKQI